MPPTSFPRFFAGAGLIPLLVAVLACQAPSLPWAPTAPPAACEAATAPTDQDVQQALAFAPNVFAAPDWERSYTVGTERVSVSWINNELGALAYWEYVVFPCGYTSTTVAEYFSAESFATVIFSNYQNLQPHATCTHPTAHLALHNFTAEANETAYQIRYWIKTDAPTHILSVMLTFPPAAEKQLVAYATALFPDFAACPN